MFPLHSKKKFFRKDKRLEIAAVTVALVIFMLLVATPGATAQQTGGLQASGIAPGSNGQAAPALTLDDLEKMALAHNPTLSQVRENIQITEGDKLQSGLYPNPTAGYIGEQIRGGVERGGEQGIFIQQNIVLGGKLGLNRQIFEQERREALAEADEQRLRVTTSVTLYFIRALAAQQTVAVRRQLAHLAEEAVVTSRQLFNVGEADRPDVLEAEVEAQQAQLALTAAEQNQQGVWQGLAAAVGVPELPFAPLQGNLETFGSLDANSWLATMLQNSPEVKIAEFDVSRAEAVLARARREPVPNLQFRAGLEQNRELSEFSRLPIGLQGFADVGVEIPLFDRNQGNVEAAQAQLGLARQEVDRVRLVLRQRAAPVFQNYETALTAARAYKDLMIPSAQQAYNLYLESYKQMAAAYPQVLIAQRTLFQLEDAYIASLEELGTSAIALNSFLLTDGLATPGQTGQEGLPAGQVALPGAMEGLVPRE